MTGGQTWSLVTENRRGTDARTEILPQTIDPQYLVGYSWERQPGIRIQQHFGKYETHGFTAALSLEQAQITNFTANGTNPSQYFFGGLGQNGGLYNAAAVGSWCDDDHDHLLHADLHLNLRDLGDGRRRATSPRMRTTLLRT